MIFMIESFGMLQLTVSSDWKKQNVTMDKSLINYEEKKKAE